MGFNSVYCLLVQPLVQEAMKIVARCARLKSSRGELRKAVEQATGKFAVALVYSILHSHPFADSLCFPVEKDDAEKHVAKLEVELDSLQKELEGRRAGEEKAAQAHNALATKLLSLASGLSGEPLDLYVLLS